MSRYHERFDPDLKITPGEACERTHDWLDGKLLTLASPGHDTLVTLMEYVHGLEAERDELRERVKELEVYEEIEMIGPHPGLPTVGGAFRERDAAQAEAENTRYQLDWANERIQDLENDIRSHKRVCPMFR